MPRAPDPDTVPPCLGATQPREAEPRRCSRPVSPGRDEPLSGDGRTVNVGRGEIPRSEQRPRRRTAHQKGTEDGKKQNGEKNGGGAASCHRRTSLSRGAACEI